MTKLRTLKLTPSPHEANKPQELIQVTGHQDLSLNARRAITILWNNAHLQKVAVGKDYTIRIKDLKPAGHNGYEMVKKAVEALMRTILTVKLPDGRIRRVQFLGGNDMDSEDREDGTLTYSFDKRLLEILEDSTIWGKITLSVIMAFSSKYAVSFYENIAQYVQLTYKSHHVYSLEEFRQLLGVPIGRYKTFGELNKHVIKPALAEINALAPFGIALRPIKKGKPVVGIRIDWWKKEQEDRRIAAEEVDRSKIGRRARIAGTIDIITDTSPLLSNDTR